MYGLPHPLQLLDNPLSKYSFKKLAKSHVVDYWEQKLRAASFLPSLRYFHPEYMSLVKPHQLWLTAGSNPYEVGKAATQALFLSSRYRSEQLCRHWSTNKLGVCLAPTCVNQGESIEHILIFCPAYVLARERLKLLWLSFEDPVIHGLVSNTLLDPPEKFMQFLLDCSVIPLYTIFIS